MYECHKFLIIYFTQYQLISTYHYNHKRFIIGLNMIMAVTHDITHLVYINIFNSIHFGRMHHLFEKCSQHSDFFLMYFYISENIHSIIVVGSLVNLHLYVDSSKFLSEQIRYIPWKFIFICHFCVDTFNKFRDAISYIYKSLYSVKF